MRAAAHSSWTMSKFLFCESSSNLGGQELQILLQMAALRQSGHEVMLACHPSSAISVEAGVRRLEWTPVTFRNSWHLPSILTLRRLIKARHIDVAFCHSGHDADTLAAATTLLRRRPLLIRARTYQPGLPKAHTYNRMVDRTVVPSEHLRRMILVNTKIRPERIAVLRPIVSVGDIRAASRLPLPEGLSAALRGAPIIVHAAMLRPEKGHGTVLAALVDLLRRYPALRYVMAGSGPEEAALRQQVRRLGLEHNVIFAGFVMPVFPLLARADLVVMPSLDEPLGLAHLEALALGIPVAVSDAGGLPETVTHGETGWIWRAGDVAAWRGGLDYALANPGRARTLAERGRAFVDAVFAPQAHLAALEDQLALARR
jgi:glycosyltransferase involved in cell wall biosynthesis